MPTEQEDSDARRRRRRIVDGVLPLGKGLRRHGHRTEQQVGGLARTCTYSGHPYEFGPHIWFWPGGKDDPVNATIVKLTNDELFYIDRRLFTFVESDQRKYRYPVHYQDIAEMPDKDTIYREVKQHRDDKLKLIESQLPELGQCTFGDYFTAAIGATLYQKFMANYTWKMWNIPGDELQTSMVWADRFHHAYTKQVATGEPRPWRLRPAEVRGSHARQGHPVPGVPEARLECGLGRDGRAGNGHPDRDRPHRRRTQEAVRAARRAARSTTSPTTTRCSARSTSTSCGARDTLPYTGRMMIPLLIPGLAQRVP